MTLTKFNLLVKNLMTKTERKQIKVRKFHRGLDKVETKIDRKHKVKRVVLLLSSLVKMQNPRALRLRKLPISHAKRVSSYIKEDALLALKVPIGMEQTALGRG